MFKVSSKAKQLIPYLLGTIIVLYMLKPSFVFKPNGKPRQYGIGHDTEGYKKTLYSLQTVIIFVVILLIVFV